MKNEFFEYLYCERIKTELNKNPLQTSPRMQGEA